MNTVKHWLEKIRMWLFGHFVLVKYKILRRFYGPPQQRSIPLQVENPDAIMGSLSWTIRDTPTNQVLEERRTPLRAKDFKIIEVRGQGETYYNKCLALNELFVFSIAEHPTPAEHPATGFGLVAKRTDQVTFCWEWFIHKDVGRVAKLQESGELGIRYSYSVSGWEVVETTFLTDVDLRVHESGQSVGDEPRWRVTIHQGSTIRWPFGAGHWAESL